MGAHARVRAGSRWRGFADDTAHDAHGFSDRVPALDIYRPDFNPAWVLINRYRWDFSQHSIYSSVRIKALDTVTVVLGARSLRKLTYTTRTDLPNYVPTSDLHVSNETTPYAGVIWDISHDLSLYASYAEQFTPQALVSASGSILPPIQGKQVETGIKSDFFDERLNASLALYRIRENNRSLVDPDNMGCPPFGICFIPSGLVQSQGVEAEVRGSPMHGLQLIAGYTYNQNKYLEEAPDRIGQQFNGRTPWHLFKVWGTYQLTNGGLEAASSGWTVGAGVIVQSSTFASDLVKQGGYAVASASVSYRFNPKTALTLNANNLFDRHYLQSIQVSSGNHFGTPLNAQLTIRHQF
ncbi:MAG: TonB-dependent receptor [Steroidobacteraceae bacterium]